MSMTIQQAIDKIISSIPGAPFPDTVDTVKTGDASREITSIAVTFLANADVIEQVGKTGANLLITHEPTFYTHLDSAEWLTSDPVYQAKRRLIDEHGLVIWRFHDYLHSLPPDNTVMGLINALGWEANGREDQPHIIHIPATTLLELSERVKKLLGLASLRIVGNLSAPIQKVAVLPGFPPSAFQIGSLGHEGADVLITGEIHEWEISEYVRDANKFGGSKSLIVTGHMASETPGMERIIPWLRERLPGIKIQFVPSSSPFQYV